MTKAINGHSTPNSDMAMAIAMAMAIVAIRVAPPLNIVRNGYAIERI